MKKLILAAGVAFGAITLQAQNVELDIERSVKVEFNSQKGYSYNVYGTSDPAQKTGWKLLGGEEGTGENIVFFYRSDSDQKVFFRIESEPSEGGQDPTPPQPEASVIPITGLPPAESSGTYNLGEAIGETEVGGVYRIGISAGTDGVVIELPHPGLQEYRQKQIKLSIYRGGTGLGSGKVSLKVPTLAGDEYESRKLVDNGAKQLTGEVIILPATASNDGRKVIVELFNDTASTDGAAGGQWVVTTAAEAMKSTLAHRWEGTSLALQKSDGTWEDWVNLQGSQGIRGPEGPQGSAGPQGIAGPEGSQGLLGPRGNRGPEGPRGIPGPTGSKGAQGSEGPRGSKGVQGVAGPAGPKGPTGNVSAQGYDISVLWAAVKCDWSNKNFDGKDLNGILFSQKGVKVLSESYAPRIITNTSFKNTNLKFILMDHIDELRDCNFSGADIIIEFDADVIFRNCNFEGAKLSYTHYSNNEIINWAAAEGRWSIESMNFYYRPRYINCIMPDGSKVNDPEP